MMTANVPCGWVSQDFLTIIGPERQGLAIIRVSHMTRSQFTGLRVEHFTGAINVDAADLRVVAAAVFAITADAVLVALHLLKLGAHLATALALRVRNLARRSSLEARSTRQKKGGEDRRSVRNFVWQFGTGDMNKPSDVPRCRPLSLLQKPLHCKGIQQNSFLALV
jgi:hypothetical protein